MPLRSLRRLTPRLLAFAVAVGAGGAAQADDAGLTARVSGLQSDANTLADLRFDSAEVSVSARARRLDSPRDAVAWIRDNITFDPYDGSMRGARGTLLSRGGNALDRALLLGAFLGDMGYQWRVASGRLDDTQARHLARDVTSDGSLAGEAVPRGLSGHDPGADGRVRASVSDHYWVQARVGGSWRDYDPTYPGLSAGDSAVEATATFAPGEVPDTATQRVTIGVYFETNGSDGGVALSHETTVADAAYRNLTLTFDHDDTGMTPVLEAVGDTRSGSRITLVGLERVWVQFVFALGNAERRVVRDIYTSSSAIDLAHVDDHVFSIVLLPGFVGTDYYHAVLSVLLGGFSDNASALRRVIASDGEATEVTPTLSTTTRAQTSLALGVSSLAFAHASDRLAVRVARSLGVRPYYPEPRILIAGAYRRGGATEYQLDLRSNDLAAQPLEGVPSAVVPAFETVRGVLDTTLSGHVLSLVTGRDASSVDQVIHESVATGARMVTVHPGTVGRLRSLDLADEPVERLRDAVNDDGDIALAPNRPLHVDDADIFGWWQLSPGTGRIMGVTAYGGHDAATFVPTGFDDDGRPIGTRVIDETLDLLEAVMAGAGMIAADPDFGSDLVCAAMCDVRTMRRAVCSDERDRSIPRLGGCLRGTTASDTGSFLPVGASCAAQLTSFYCGAATVEAFAEGGVSFEMGLTPALPTPFVGAGAFDWTACTCDGGEGDADSVEGAASP